ncbi:hypothetical protein ES703_74643 [subsurface metagenome]
MNGKDYTIKFNGFELGVLTGVIMQSDDRSQRALKPVWEQLMALKKQFEEETGVTKEIIPGGMLRITDRDGNVIIRAPYPWEVEGN